jgi:hypothetical protein
MQSDDEDDREDALIHSDRAVEVAVAAYAGLPDRVRRAQIPREQGDKARGSSFPEKLNFLEWFLSTRDRAAGTLLEDAAHYHSLRNPAYHATTGFVPAMEDVQGAFSTAVEVFRALFDFDPMPMLAASVETAPPRAAETRASYGVDETNKRAAKAYRRRPGDWDQLVARATDWGVGPGLRALKSAGEAVAMVPRVTYHTLTLYSPLDRRITLIWVTPDWRNGGRLRVGVAGFEKFLAAYAGLTGEQYRRLVDGETPRMLTSDDAVAFSRRLARILSARQT